VSLPKLDQPVGTAYVNLIADWDRSGRWQGVDRKCGAKNPPPEWAIQNFAIDLAQQKTQTKLYRISFRAGSARGPLWYRVTLSVDEPLMDGSGTGFFERGEIEGHLVHGLPKRDKKGKVWCTARKLKHGKSAVFKIMRNAGAGTIIASRLTGRNPGVNAADTKASTRTWGVRKLNNRRYRLTSTHVHTMKGFPIEAASFDVRVLTRQSGLTRTQVVRCNAAIRHDHPHEPDGDNDQTDKPGGFVEIGPDEFNFDVTLTYRVNSPTNVDLCVVVETEAKKGGEQYKWVAAGPGHQSVWTNRTLDTNGRDSFTINVNTPDLSNRLPQGYTVQVHMRKGIAFTFHMPMVEVVLDGSNCVL
jgi:hypothetical protein